MLISREEFFKVGICDDQQLIHDEIERMLQLYAESKNIILDLKHYDSAKQLLEKRDELDCLLLDIEMPEMDGIEAGYKLRERKIEYKIIMLTAMVERYKEAFKIRAFRFVPKPIDRDELYQALDDVRGHMVGRQTVTVFRDGLPFEIAQQDIFYLESARSATRIYTSNLEFRSERSLSEWSEILDEARFFRCHKSYIVNLGKIQTIETNIIQLKSGDKVTVSRRLKTSLLHAYMQYDIKWR